MRDNTITLPRQRQRLTLRSFPRMNLQPAAAVLRTMQPDTAALQARVKELETALRKANAATVARAHREDRLNAVTIREVDNRAAWYAKQPKGRQPQVILTPRHVITAEVWQQPPPAEG
jgi:hypothetical protein